MILKIASLMLLLIAAVAIFGGMRLKRKKSIACKDCGKPLIGKGECGCAGQQGRRRG